MAMPASRRGDFMQHVSKRLMNWASIIEPSTLE